MTLTRFGYAALAALAIFAAAASSSTAAGGETVGVKDFDFGPGSVRISTGERVTWVNQEGSHTVTFKNGYNEVLSDEGEKTSRRFKRPGTYEYLCSFHDDQGMKGKVVVRK